MIATTTTSKLLDKQMPQTLTKAMVITNEIEHASDWKYIGSDIGIAIAWVMTSPNKRDMTCDEDDHVYVQIAFKNKKSPSEE